MNTITVQELKNMRDTGVEHQLIDVREVYEVEEANIGGLSIPMGQVLAHLDEIRRDIPVVIHCRSGARSAAVISALEANAGYTNLHNLKGGILAWITEIEPSLLD
ncbi:MAG: hypothetical protein RL226_2164 [Bacteroidota bacterium]|jgi:adenylyltransferase/sulfurtransferase